MNFEILFGTSLWARSLLYFAVGVATVVFLATIFTVLYQRVLYGRLYRPRYDEAYRPRCSIILPCKGLPRDLEGNLRSFLDLDYPDYEVIYTVESEQDPAVEVIRRVIAGHDNARLVVAGLSTKCAQKNYNMLAAIRQANDPEVLVFADADIGPSGHWLHELVLPLSSDKVTATSGFRWQYSTSGKFGEQVHSYMNNLLYILFTAACYVGGIGLWGGSMAMRRRDFELLGVADFWAETVVDDMSLSRIVMKKRKKAVLVPPAITDTDDALGSMRQGIRWFERQAMFLKAYHPVTWLLVLPLVLAVMILLIWLPMALVVSKGSLQEFLALGGGASLLFVAGGLVTTLLYPMLGTNPTFIRFLLLQPFALFSMLLSVAKTPFTNTITWSGVRYKLTLSGRVKHVDRSRL
jgi:cellulose synthase/poly-beta-1,6-N-acetylglucosamine synthase-like glycosyltransferase